MPTPLSQLATKSSNIHIHISRVHPKVFHLVRECVSAQSTNKKKGDSELLDRINQVLGEDDTVYDYNVLTASLHE
jgi:hypothetical protein